MCASQGEHKVSHCHPNQAPPETYSYEYLLTCVDARAGGLNTATCKYMLGTYTGPTEMCGCASDFKGGTAPRLDNVQG